jgi:hypothetical protein
MQKKKAQDMVTVVDTSITVTMFVGDLLSLQYDLSLMNMGYINRPRVGMVPISMTMITLFNTLMEQKNDVPVKP